VRGKVGVMPLPSGAAGEPGRGTLGGAALAVSRYSRHPAIAAALVAHLAGQEEQRRRALEGSFAPTIVALYDDAELRARHPFIAGMRAAVAAAVARPVREAEGRYARISHAFWSGAHAAISDARSRRRRSPSSMRGSSGCAGACGDARGRDERGRRRPTAVAERGGLAPFLWTLPALGVLVATTAWPLAQTLGLSLTDATLFADRAARFVGLANYRALLVDPDWWAAVGVTLTFAAASVALETILGLGIALVLAASFPGRGLLRAAVLVPWAIPTVVSAKIWAWMYHDLHGVLNAALLGLGLVAEPVAWTADPATALAAVIVVDVWKTTPFVAILALAALQMVPQGVYEAARVDGAGPLATFLRITLPLIRPALVVAVTFRLLDALRAFDLVYVLTGNRPETTTVSMFVRQQLIDFQDTGYGSAAATLTLFLIALATVLYVMAGRRPSGIES
jgi:trehalose/maltose transport system permease protein